eukprot:4759016-Amphidinium_carterae.3
MPKQGFRKGVHCAAQGCEATETTCVFLARSMNRDKLRIESLQQPSADGLVCFNVPVHHPGNSAHSIQ